MIQYLSLHAESARRAAGYFFKQPVATLLILAMLAIAMALPLTLYLGVQSSQSVLDKLSEVPQITLYFEQNAQQSDIEAVRKLLADDKQVKEFKFVGKEQGLDELKEAMGTQDAVSMLDENPLPDVFVVTPANANPQAVLKLQGNLAQYPMVEQAQMDQEWMQTLYRVNDLVKKVLWFLAVTLSVAFVLVAHNTIRLQILSHKEEIEITKLLGAPSSFVRRPFLYQAVWQGVLSVVVSLLLCAWVLQAVRPLVNQIFKPYGINLQWRTFEMWEIAAVFAGVCALGVVGAWLATTQHLLGFKARRN
ncbi:permease-like cell division protein FtsX [Conchiformibius kuhniae]|uniref:Cell division protein FtsX n=1 Tax=Conchiformibius kuhniae TaxID=211502 RepID=A0A8T9MRM6_9NEIS|nr:permease-like cell division protein FtsX [Conchiformibius kuhniae]UOP04247.1 permease-like cell division protein FtsX [Conchiformibius kuhniae]